MKGLLSHFASSVRAEREKQGLSMNALSTVAGIQASTLSRLEKGERAQPTLETVLRVAWALSIEPRLLLPSLAEIQKEFSVSILAHESPSN